VTRAAEGRIFIARPTRAREPFAPDFSFVAKENERISNATVKDDE